jgi:hypothetical protein
MKVTLYRVQLSHLWNNEYCLFVSQFVAIFLKYNSEQLRLQKAFNRLNATLPEIAKIKAYELSNAISNELADLNNERRTLIVAIKKQAKTFSKLSMARVSQHVEVMMRFINKHGLDIGDTNYSDNTKRFNDLIADYDNTSAVRDAASVLSCSILFEQLRSVNTQFANLFMQRTQEDSAVEMVDTHAIRRETDKVLNDFLNAFEFCSLEYDELDYKTPANELNDLISFYKTELKARTTRRNNGKKVHTEAPITVG